jgi:hypothetical protein
MISGFMLVYLIEKIKIKKRSAVLACFRSAPRVRPAQLLRAALGEAGGAGPALRWLQGARQQPGLLLPLLAGPPIPLLLVLDFSCCI